MRLSSSQSGQSLVEIGALLALVSLTAILGLSILGKNIETVFCQVASTLGGDDVCEAGPLFHDSFDNLDAWYKEYGNWQLKDGQLCIKDGGRIFRPVEPNDYRIRVDQSMLVNGPGHGVFFRATNFDTKTKVNGYTFQYDKGLNQFVMRKWTDGSEAGPFARVNVPANYDWYNTNRQIELEVKGNTFTAYIDGVQVLTGSDTSATPYTTGGVGFRTWYGSEACFDNLSVSALP
ncbi:family 16 glycoside hydrolase [Candidatus Chloroploca asiatica]|uniref:3-keto-alpha-glucoside-1,2-lyase/3-keto-2-hydroxy-glucal hydratase domain-containing protein n=1 Tax=Candidatus Chloroploca asiatica TaxID=1506545 RepID=A0A2H3L061_9CHLR|nr:family 16 glycoside hydrolase [Candidatus Chloroploca asiatica]PDV99695.1 hypothetical protein A9Q02_00285 [Candidatus Chloroploca asiatica]